MPFVDCHGSSDKNDRLTTFDTWRTSPSARMIAVLDNKQQSRYVKKVLTQSTARPFWMFYCNSSTTRTKPVAAR